jgi:hypothetical protein
MKFQTTKWDVEITWEQLTITPTGTTAGQSHTRAEEANENSHPRTAHYFLFNLLGQLGGAEQKQEQLSQ